MSILQFKHEEGDTPFGIFHPTGYLIAAFESEEKARNAADALLDNSFATDVVEAVPGPDVAHAIENSHPPDDAMEKLKATIAKTIGTEGYFWEEDLRLARNGAGFVTVYCGDNERAHRAADILRELKPKTMRRYRPFAIEDLLQRPPAAQ